MYAGLGFKIFFLVLPFFSIFQPISLISMYIGIDARRETGLFVECSVRPSLYFPLVCTFHGYARELHVARNFCTLIICTDVRWTYLSWC